MGQPRDLYRQWGTTHYLNESQDTGLGFQAQRLFEEEAAHGSSRLLDKINSLFAKWEYRHGFQPGAAALLLPAGYNPERQREAA